MTGVDPRSTTSSEDVGWGECRPFDIFHQINMLWPGLLGKDKYEFSKSYCSIKFGNRSQGKVFQQDSSREAVDSILLRLFAGEPFFAHTRLLEQKRLHVLPSIFSPELLRLWQEPSIVFCPHWSLRLGPAVHFLQRWRSNKNSLLVLEKGVDADLALLPFKPVMMKVLQCSFLSTVR
ncbi:hypothetical protein Dimus_013917 [Dionaea muscipula]